MAVITFSRQFPKGHPKAGQQTHFVEAILTQLGINYTDHDYFLLLLKLNPERTELELQSFFDSLSVDIDPKGHTIRTGNRWKVGDKFSPRVWSGKPYQSKQIQFAPDIEIKKIWGIQIIQYTERWSFYLDGRPVEEGRENFNIDEFVETLAKNDGLTLPDFISWFKIHPKKTAVSGFNGQILCFNELINY